MSRRDWRGYIQGHGSAEPNSAKVNSIIRDWIEVYLKEASVAIDNLETMLKAETVDSTVSKIKVLIDRWNQIKHLCEETVSKLD